MTWQDDPAEVRKELEAIEADLPYRRQQLEHATAALNQQRQRTETVYGANYPASSHHAIQQLEDAADAARKSLCDGIAWREELQQLLQGAAA